MPRPLRITPGDMVFHVMNRSVLGIPLFKTDQDYLYFLSILEETRKLYPMRICAYCIMPNHWHFVLWPKGDDDIPAFMHRLTTTHAVTWQKYHNTVGSGHVYQGRYLSIPIGHGDHMFRIIRYVERNALRANLVEKAEYWRWGSLRQRVKDCFDSPITLSGWPQPQPIDWLNYVNTPLTAPELRAIRHHINRGIPYGDEKWIRKVVHDLGLESTLIERGKYPRK